MENQEQEDCTTYIDAMELWEKSQRNLIAGHKLDLDHEKKSLELLKESISILGGRLERESTFYDDTIKRFQEYLETRNIPIPDWAK